MIVNDRDLHIAQATSRVVSSSRSKISLEVDSSNFYKRADGSHGPDVIHVTATLLFADGPITFSAQGCQLSVVTATGCQVAFSSVTSTLAVVTATAANNGYPISQSVILGVVSDGAPGQGTAGPRGPGTYYAAGSVWTDAAAEAATPGSSVVGDVVTISNGSTYALTKKYDGTNWATMGAVYDGSLFVTGTINGAALKVGTVEVRAPDGTLILGVGSGNQSVGSVATSIQNAAVATFSPIKTWSFNNDLEGWTGSNATTLTKNAQSMTVSAANGDPMLESPAISLSGGVYDKIRMRVRRLAGSAWDGSIFFNNEGVDGVSTLPNPNLALNEWRVLEWDMSGKGNWSALVINHIRVDLGASAADKFEIDWIAIGRIGVGSDEVNSRVEAMAADNVLDRGEKSQLWTEWLAHDAQWAYVRAQAANLGVDYSFYDQAHTNTANYLLSLSPGWNDVSQDTVIVRADFRESFRLMYEAKARVEAAIAAKASTTALWTNTTGRPEDQSNLVRKGTFEDTLSGSWSGGAYVQATDNANSAAVPFKKSLITHSRDCYENGNNIAITPGETIFGSAWLGTQDCNAIGGFGFIVSDKDGNILTWVALCAIPAYFQWTYREGSWTVPALIQGVNGQNGIPAIITPWLQQNIDPANPGYLRATGLWLGRHARGATLGATLGQDVKGTINDSNAAGLVTVSNLRVIGSRLGTFSTAGTARTELSDNGIKIFDGNGNLRVRIGNLSA